MKRWYFIIGLVFLILSGTACGKNTEQQIAEQIKLGEQYLLEQNYEQAIVAFNKAIELDPKQAEAYVGLADVYIQQEDYEQALVVLQEGAENTEDEESIQSKLLEVEQLIQQHNAEMASQALMSKVQELENSLGYIDAANYTSDKTGISSYVFCDVDADGMEELLVTYMAGQFSGEMDGCEIWTDLYDFQNDETVQIASQQIGNVEYCDAMTIRLFFSEQQAAFCIVTNKELVGAYTGAREFVSELYKVSVNGIELRRHWMQNSIENFDDPQDDIIAEMKRVGIPYIDMMYLSFGLENAESSQEQLLFQNTVGVAGEYAAERTYELYFTTYDELNTENNTNQFPASEEQLQLIRSRTTEGIVQEDELKEVCRPVLVTLQNLFRGCNGAAINTEDQAMGPGYPEYDDIYAAAVDFSTMDGLKEYVHSVVSDSLYENYFNEERFIEKDGKLYLPYTTYGGSMDLDSLEIENIEGNLYTISVNEYLGHEYYLQTNFIILQKTDSGWFALDVTQENLYSGNTRRYGSSEGDFI